MRTFAWRTIGPRLPPSRQWRTGLMIVSAVVVIAIAVSTALMTFRPSAFGDFRVYYAAGQIVSEGRSPYTNDTGSLPYAYAPVFAYMIFWPLAKLPYEWAARLFLLLNWVAAAAFVLLCIRTVRASIAPSTDRFLLALLALIPTGAYLRYNLYLGQVGTLVSLACVAWLYCWRSGRQGLGGLALALAIALKIYPALLLPFMLLRRDIRGLAGCCAGLAMLFLLPALWVGFSDLVPLHAEWIDFNLQKQDPAQTIRYSNQSILSFLARLPFISNGYELYSADNLKILMQWYPAIVVAIAAIAYGYIAIDQKRWRNAGSEQARTLAHVSLLFLLMTVVTPRAWPHNFAIELLPALMITAALLEGAKPKWLPPVALLGVLAAVAIPSPEPGGNWRLWAFLVMSKHLLAAVVLAIAVLATWPLRREAVAEQALIEAGRTGASAPAG